jgi:hypothetical protein
LIFHFFLFSLLFVLIQQLTAHSLLSLEPQRTPRLFILLFSIERTENNKHHALRAFKALKYRVAIDFFSFAVLSTAKEKYLYLCALCVFAVKMDTTDLFS